MRTDMNGKCFVINIGKDLIFCMICVHFSDLFNMLNLQRSAEKSVHVCLHPSSQWEKSFGSHN